mmetsp:Transcript_11500/g.27458  ORF Transcript_11500/g.27458 Transcript_11500/m.27458 type:complete len:363 (-) Transcript_11500:66-1154(-)
MDSKSTSIVIIAFLLAYGIVVPKMMLEGSFSSSSRRTASSIAATTAPPPPPPPPPQPRREEEKKKKKMCVSEGEELRHLINSTSNVYVMMPCKVAGTAFKQFTQGCMGVSPDVVNEKRGEKVLSGSFDVPSVTSHHIYNQKYMERSLRHASRRTLFVWLYREETSRLISAIRHVVKRMCQRDGGGVASDRTYDFDLLKETDKQCTIHETDLVDNVIRKKIYEIGKGNQEILTCDTYDAIRDNLPNILFVDYMQADRLMTRIAEKHCPHMLDEAPVHSNTADRKQKEVSVRLSSSSKKVVPLDDWLEQKGGYLELALKLKDNVSCQGTTSRLEDALESCEDHIVKLDDEWIGRPKRPSSVVPG